MDQFIDNVPVRQTCQNDTLDRKSGQSDRGQGWSMAGQGWSMAGRRGPGWPGDHGGEGGYPRVVGPIGQICVRQLLSTCFRTLPRTGTPRTDPAAASAWLCTAPGTLSPRFAKRDLATFLAREVTCDVTRDDDYRRCTATLCTASLGLFRGHVRPAPLRTSRYRTVPIHA